MNEVEEWLANEIPQDLFTFFNKTLGYSKET